MFKDQIEVNPRGCSRVLQRSITDFGAEESFERASFRLKEHYGIDVAISMIRNTTLDHARIIAQDQENQPKVRKLKAKGAKNIVTETDGTMLPMVRIKEGEGDRRKRREVYWKEARLAISQEHGKIQQYAAVDFKDVNSVGESWAKSAQKAGWGVGSKIHAVGDGATWIESQSKKQFGKQGTYLLDFYHVCEYLGDAAKAFVAENKRKCWLNAQKILLRNNEYPKVLKTLKKNIDKENEECAVAKAFRYLKNREDQLDYKSALKSGLPIGSGMVESGHRSILQKRLKLPGSWWDPENAESMGQLRVLRSNGDWGNHWGPVDHKIAA